jgi:hypothetical protein
MRRGQIDHHRPRRPGLHLRECGAHLKPTFHAGDRGCIPLGTPPNKKGLPPRQVFFVLIPTVDFIDYQRVSCHILLF